MTANDLDLLRQFARDHSQDAFTALVRRHLDLVHSAALRQVRSPDLAGEVAQSVFADLARNADKLKPDTILTAWLYQVTRRTAVDVVRRESRRQARERLAVEMAAMNTTTADWNHIEPLLDEAMDALDETDRAAVLLRFFENKSLREVGATLGTSDDAAQKRVTRAVERLREFFAKRGVTVGAGGLAVLISANAVQAAPVGMALAISTAAVLTGATLATTSTIAAHAATTTMNLLSLKFVVALAAAALVAGTGTYFAQQRTANRLRNENQNLTEQTGKLATERDAALAAVTAKDDELARVQRDQTELLRLRAEVGTLRAQSNQFERLKTENRDLQASLKKAGATNSTAYDPQNDAMRQLMSRRALDETKQMAMGVISYAIDHKDLVPADFGSFGPDFTSNFPNAPTGQFDLLFHDSLGAATNASETILVRGKYVLSSNGQQVRVYGYVDGHAQTIKEPPEGFEAWEKQHMQVPAPTRNQ